MVIVSCLNMNNLIQILCKFEFWVSKSPVQEVSLPSHVRECERNYSGTGYQAIPGESPNTILTNTSVFGSNRQ